MKLLRVATILGVLITLMVVGSVASGLGGSAGAASAGPAALAPAAPAATVTIQAAADTYVYQQLANDNYDSQTLLVVGDDEFTYERFTLLQFNLAAIPAGATVNSAWLDGYLQNGGSSPATIRVERLTSSWTSSGVTWDSRPGTECCWGELSVGTTTGRYYRWNVTTLVQRWVNGTYANYGLAWRGDFYPAKSFEALEHAQNHPPRLVIEYTAPTATPTQTLTPSITPTPSHTPTGSLPPTNTPTATGTPTPTPTSTAPPPPPGDIGGRVWHDANHNGLQDTGESGISSVHLNLEQDGVVLASADTNAVGYYLFSNREAGTYSVSIDDWTLPAGYVLTTGTEPRAVTLVAGEDRRDVDFGYAAPPTPTPTATPVPDLQAYSLEVTQSVQNLEQWVRLVAGKRTFVRFYARSDGGSHWSSAALHVQRGTSERWLLPLNPRAGINVGYYMPRMLEQGAFLFELPTGFRESTVTLTAYVNPGTDIVPWDRWVTETDYSNNTVTRAVSFESVPVLNLAVGRVGYQLTGDDCPSPCPTPISYWPDISHVNHLVAWLKAAYPVRDVRLQVRNYWWGDANVRVEDSARKLTSPSCGSVNSRLGYLADLFRGVAGVTRVYGMVDDGGGFMRGCSHVPARSASGPTGSGDWGWDFDGSYGDWYGGHELGHSLGREHAPFCDAEGSAYYPWPAGHIGSPDDFLGPYDWRHEFYGFDQRTLAIYEDTWYDVMTYCDREWVSDFTYEGLMDGLQARATAAGAALHTLNQAGGALVVNGTIDPATQQIALDPLFVIPDAAASVPGAPGDYALVLRDGAGLVLASYPFTPQLTHSGPPLPAAAGEDEIELLSIEERVPFVAGTDRVDIEGPDNTVLHSVSAGAAFPTVSVTQPTAGALLAGDAVKVAWTANDADGDPLDFLVAYSADGGATWETATFPTRATSAAIDAFNLPAGAAARFRVLASDGVHTTVAESDPVTVPNHVPDVAITAPADGTVWTSGQTINLAATAYDIDVGSMPDAQLTWQSDLDGVLGDGDQLSISDLSVGSHTVTLRADDGAGGVATDTVQLTVISDPRQLPGVDDALIAAPGQLFFDLSLQPLSQQLFIDNINASHSIPWEATTSESWAHLSATSGNTPATITVSLASGVPAGSIALIVLTSPAVPDQEMTIRVLVGRPATIHLPFITR